MRTLCLILLAATLAQAAPELEIVRPLPRHLPARVVFVVDVSGSMEPPELGRAIEHAIATIGCLPMDGATWTCVALGQGAVAYRGWIDHPDPEGLRSVSEWLLCRPAGESATFFAPALSLALEVAGTERTAIVWLSDGQAGDPCDLPALFAASNPSLEVDGREVRPVSWIFVGLDGGSDVLAAIAEAVDGGYLRYPAATTIGDHHGWTPHTPTPKHRTPAPRHHQR